MPPSGKECAHRAGGAESARGAGPLPRMPCVVRMDRNVRIQKFTTAHAVPHVRPRTLRAIASSAHGASSCATVDLTFVPSLSGSCRKSRTSWFRLVPRMERSAGPTRSSRNSFTFMDHRVRGHEIRVNDDACRPGRRRTSWAREPGGPSDVGGQRWRWRDGVREPLSVPVQVTQRHADGGRRLIGDRFLDAHGQIALAFTATR